MSAKVCHEMENAAKSTGIVIIASLLESGSGCIIPLTEPKSNASYGAKFYGLCIFRWSQNLSDFAFDKKK